MQHGIAFGEFQFFREIAAFSSKISSFNIFFWLIWKKLHIESFITFHALNCSLLRQSVFRTVFLILFESIETSPGFARLFY